MKTHGLLWRFFPFFIVLSVIGTSNSLNTAQSLPPTTSLAWSDDGQVLVIGIAENLNIFRLDHPEPYVITTDAPIRAIELNHDGSHLAWFDDDLIFHIWDNKSNQSIAEHHLNGYYTSLDRLYFHPTEDILTFLLNSVSNGVNPIPTGIWFWEYQTEKQPRIIPTSEALGEYLLAFNHTMTLAVTTQIASQQRTGRPVALMNIRDTVSGDFTQRWGDVRPQFSETLFSPTDANLLLTLNTSGLVSLWDAQVAHELFTLPAPENTVTTAIFSPDGTIIVTGGADGVIRLWSAIDGNLLDHFDNQPEDIQYLRMNAEGTIWALVHTQQQIEIWDVLSNQKQFSLEFDSLSPITTPPSP